MIVLVPAPHTCDGVLGGGAVYPGRQGGGWRPVDPAAAARHPPALVAVRLQIYQELPI